MLARLAKAQLQGERAELRERQLSSEGIITWRTPLLAQVSEKKECFFSFLFFFVAGKDWLISLAEEIVLSNPHL